MTLDIVRDEADEMVKSETANAAAKTHADTGAKDVACLVEEHWRGCRPVRWTCQRSPRVSRTEVAAYVRE